MEPRHFVETDHASPKADVESRKHYRSICEFSALRVARHL